MYMLQTRLDTHLHLYLRSHARLVHAAAWRMVRVGDGTIHARQGALGHVLHPVPGRRDAAGGRPAAHPVGRGRPDGGPPRAEPLAPGLEEPIRGVDARGVGGAVRHGVVYDGFRVSVERVWGVRRLEGRDEGMGETLEINVKGGWSGVQYTMVTAICGSIKEFV